MWNKRYIKLDYAEFNKLCSLLGFTNGVILGLSWCDNREVIKKALEEIKVAQDLLLSKIEFI